MKKLICLLLFMFNVFSEDFNGMRFIANYNKCDEWVIAEPLILQQFVVTALLSAGIETVHSNTHSVTVDGKKEIFIYLVADGVHVTVHTFDDDRLCFVDLFSRNKDCEYGKFAKQLQYLLNPKKHSELILDCNSNFQSFKLVDSLK